MNNKKEKNELYSKASGDLLSFVDSCPTPFHTVQLSKKRLIDQGFKELFEEELWELSHGGSYLITRNDSSIIARTIGPFPLDFFN